jgi:hypothetical protein
MIQSLNTIKLLLHYYENFVSETVTYLSLVIMLMTNLGCVVWLNMQKRFRAATVRSYWGHLMRNGTARREHADIQVHNVVTLATRVRIQILKVITLVAYMFTVLV